MKNSFLKLLTILAVMPFLVSCDDDSDGPANEKTGSGNFFISVSGDNAEYIIQTESIEAGSLLISDNIAELEMSGYTWVFNSSPSIAIGLIYNQGDPGIGLGYAISPGGTMQRQGQFQISSRFTSYGFFENYALTSVGGQTPVENGTALVDNNGNERTDGVTFNFVDINSLQLTQKTITTLGITGTGEQATLSGIVDMGNGTFLSGLVCSQPRDEESASGGSSSGTVTYPDSVWVAAFDADLNIKNIYRDNRISYSSGRYRSQYYSQIGRADDGTVYVFSGSFESTTTHPCGALKINKNADRFDEDYYFNIEALTNGYNFRKVWHITGDYFMLEIYNDTEPTSLGAASQYGIVNMTAKTFSWIDGIPSMDKITPTGQPMAYGEKMYFPVTAEGDDPVIYVIDPAQSSATKGLTVRGAASINSVGRLTR